VVLGVTFALFAIGGMGGGDAKLLAATALWMGFGVSLVDYLVTSALLGGLLTLAILVFRGSPVAAITGNNIFLRHLADRKTGIPYGIALGIGGMLAFPGTSLAGWALAKVAAGG